MISFERYAQLQRKDDNEGLHEESKHVFNDSGNVAGPKTGEHCSRILIFLYIGFVDYINLSSFLTSVICNLTGQMVLSFEPLTVTFQDVQYYINIPQVVL